MFNKRLRKGAAFVDVPIRQVLICTKGAHYYIVCGLRLTSISTDWILC